jgi:hypothetical protein
MSLASRVMKVLEQSERPVSVDYVRYHAGTSWGMAKATLLELLVREEIRGLKTTKAWIFWIPIDTKSESQAANRDRNPEPSPRKALNA